jgi:hypothetical protein
MRRRNKPRLSAAKKAAIAAAVTVVILAAGYAAFDAYMDQWNRNYSPGAFAEQPVESSSSAASSQSPSSSGEGADQNGDVEASIEKILRSHAWQQDGNAKATVQFRDGSFVESDGTNAKVTAMTVTKAAWNGTEGTLECKLTADGDQTERSTVIKVSGNEGSFKVASDGFLVSKEYVQGNASASAVAVEGVTEPYTTLIQGRTPDLAKAVASYCRDHVPTATKAVFDGEVYLDIPGGRTTATFTCDDTAATVLNVVFANGSFEVQG